MKLRHASPQESRLLVYLSILAMIGLQIAISDKLTLGPKNLLAGLELILLCGAVLTHATGNPNLKHVKRTVSLLLIMVVTFTNIGSLGLVVGHLVDGSVVNGRSLLLSAVAIYITNILIFGLWYWEMDSPGLSGYQEPHRGPDFLFPQMTARDVHPVLKNWVPSYFDYLYVSITNASAFSPTDALPLTTRTKTLMTIQSLSSFATVALVTARAVNILK